MIISCYSLTQFGIGSLPILALRFCATVAGRAVTFLQPATNMPAKTDWIGKRFSRWIVISETEKLPNSKIRRFICRCDCGTVKAVQICNLPSGTSKSCGCYNSEVASLRKNGLIHGGWGTKTFTSWMSMRARCREKNRIHYFQKGIKVCDRWLNSFENFLADMGERPEGTTLDRIDSNGNYCPENCRWSTPKQQARNKSSNMVLTFNGASKTLIEWSESVGIMADTIRKRIVLHGWSVEKALKTKSKKDVWFLL